jgi:hypothetical protein
MKDHLIFDVTDASTILDSDSVGAFVRAGDDGTQIGHVADALKVSIANTTIDVSGSTVELGATTLAALESITVVATNLDIRDLVFATDKVDVSGSTVELGATTLAALESITVVATALDIRPLIYSTDNIAIKGSTGNQLVVNADGSINVEANVSVVNGSDKLEDVAHVSGDVGTYVLAVRQDTLAASTSTDGDYASFKTSAAGALYVNLAESSATITTSDAALANGTIIAKALVLGAANTAQAAVSAPLASRKYLSIYNMDNNKIFIGGSGVSAATGFPLSPGSYMELRAGASSAVNFVGSAGKTPEIRSLELA